jgi:hypothetical protein
MYSITSALFHLKPAKYHLLHCKTASKYKYPKYFIFSPFQGVLGSKVSDYSNIRDVKRYSIRNIPPVSCQTVTRVPNHNRNTPSLHLKLNIETQFPLPIRNLRGGVVRDLFVFSGPPLHWRIENININYSNNINSIWKLWKFRTLEYCFTHR